MEEKETNYNLEDLTRYRPAVAAAQFYKEKNETAAEGALEKLVSTLDMGKDGPVFLKRIRESKEGNKILVNMFAPEYEKILMGAKIKDLFGLYSDYFKEYIMGDSYGEAERIFEEYGNENYGDMLSKVIGATETLNSKRPNLTDEEKKKAQEIIAEYGRITTPIQNFEQLEMGKLSQPIKKNALKKELTEMFKTEDKEMEESYKLPMAA